MKALKENQRLESLVPYFYASTAGKSPPVVTNRLITTIGVTRWCEAVVLAERGRLDEARLRSHVFFRYLAMDSWIYLDRCEQRASADLDKTQRGQIKIAPIDTRRLAGFFLTVALGVAVGELAIAETLGHRLVRLFTTSHPYLEPDALTGGPVAPFLLELFHRWKGLGASQMLTNGSLRGPFQSLFQHWHDADALEVELFQLCEVHGAKAANPRLPIRDGIYGLEQSPYCEYPAEVVFLQRVRRDLGLSVPDPEHPMLRSPLAKLSEAACRSGYDQPLSDAYRMCREQMPGLSVPWEEEFLKAGPTDPLTLSMTDLFEVRAETPDSQPPSF